MFNVSFGNSATFTVVITVWMSLEGEQMLSIFTTYKQGLEQGNVFTPVCHSIHSGGWLPSMHHWSHHWGDDLHLVGSASGGLHLGGLHLGGLHPRGLHLLHPEGVCIHGGWGGGQTSSPPDADPPLGYYWIWSRSGPYASYWNAFLFSQVFRKKTIKLQVSCLAYAKSVLW